MILKDRSLPHPVLAPFRDDVLPNKCELAMEVNFDADNYYLRLSMAVENSTIAAFVGAGHAAYAYKVECRRNFYRHLFRFGRGGAQVTIPAAELLGRVDVTGMIVATQPIAAYSVEGAHADYEGSTFDLLTGDVMAVALQRTFDAYTDYDPLRNVSSFLVIRESDSAEDGPMELDTTGDKIIATLSKSDFKRYGDLRVDTPIVPLLANQVIVPAMVQALSEMAMDQTDELRDDARTRSRWYRSIDRKLASLGIDLPGGTYTPLHVAQVILGEPIRRSLATLQQATAEEPD